MTKPFNYADLCAGHPVKTHVGFPVTIYNTAMRRAKQTFIAGCFQDGEFDHLGEWDNKGNHNNIAAYNLVMAPVATLDGRDVYPGDKLQHRTKASYIIVQKGTKHVDEYMWPAPDKHYLAEFEAASIKLGLGERYLNKDDPYVNAAWSGWKMAINTLGLQPTTKIIDILQGYATSYGDISRQGNGGAVYPGAVEIDFTQNIIPAVKAAIHHSGLVLCAHPAHPTKPFYAPQVVADALHKVTLLNGCLPHKCTTDYNYGAPIDKGHHQAIWNAAINAAIEFIHGA